MSCFDQEYYAGLVRVGYRDTIGGSTTWITDKITTDSEISYELNPVETSTGALFGGRILNCNFIMAGSSNLSDLLELQRARVKKYIEFLFDDGRVYITQVPVGLIIEDLLTVDSRNGVARYSLKLSRISKSPLLFLEPAFVIKINTALGDGSNTVKLPIKGDCVTVNWDDGVESSHSQTDEITEQNSVTHTYNAAGIYELTLTGFLEAVKWWVLPAQQRAMVIGGTNNSWGYFRYTDLNEGFRGCTNYAPEYVDVPNFNDLKTTGLFSTFWNCFAFNGDVSRWNTSAITRFLGTFRNCKVFNQNVNDWDVSNVTSFFAPFDGCEAFNSPLNNWNTISAESFFAMFRNAKSFNQPLNTWDTRNVETLLDLFRGAESFNQPLNAWNTSKLRSVGATFTGALSFNQNINGWDTSNVEFSYAAFADAEAFNQPLDNWKTSKFKNMNSIFRGAISFNQSLDTWDVSSATDLRNAFKGATSFNRDLGMWNIGNTVFLDEMLANCGMDIGNASKTIIGWANRALFEGVQPETNLGMQGLSIDGLVRNDAYRATDSGAFNDAVSAKAYLENTWNWTILMSYI